MYQYCNCHLQTTGYCWLFLLGHIWIYLFLSFHIQIARTIVISFKLYGLVIVELKFISIIMIRTKATSCQQWQRILWSNMIKIAFPPEQIYRIVALGNLDPTNEWKNKCFAPVLSQLELCLLTALVVRYKRLLTSGSVNQAFCPSYLSKGENYLCDPPPVCPLTPLGTDLKLKRLFIVLKDCQNISMNWH